MSARVLTFSDYYLPGFKAGGPVRTLVNMVERLGDRCEFRIVTRDRDAFDRLPYPDIPPGEWRSVRGARVFYLAPGAQTARAIREVIRATPHDVLYLNSFFSPRFTVMPLVLRRAGAIPARPVVLAPRGEFSPGALALKAPKKRAFLAAAKAAGLYRDVVWQASSPLEEADIRRWFGDVAHVVVAQDLPGRPSEESTAPAREPKRPGRLRAVFVSRICEKKNLDGALRLLRSVAGEVELDVFGPPEDPAYWARCEALMAELPANIRVRYRGELPPEAVVPTMRGYELFFLPTHGENFGHVIQEALLAGCPLLISDQTPWRMLQEKGVGWDLPLNRPEWFRQTLERCVAMDDPEHRELASRARRFGVQCSLDEEHLEQNRRLFRVALGEGGAGSGRTMAAGGGAVTR